MKYYLKLIYVFITILFLADVCFSQERNEITGEYFFKNGNFYEAISLKKDGQFIYQCRGHFINEQSVGNWQIRGNEVILDSRPQRDRLIVNESFKRGLKGKQILVRNKENEFINYTIVGIKGMRDTVIIRDQWKSTLFDNSINSFYLIDNKGLCSPVYLIKGFKSNIFSVLFETKRVFENESWEIKNGEIIPKNAGGKAQNYSLQRGRG